MGIVDIKNVPNNLWDQLITLKDLANTVHEIPEDIIDNIRSELTDLKKKSDDLQVLKAANDITTQNLKDAMDANTKSIDDLNAAQIASDQSAAVAIAQLNKANAAQKVLAQAQTDFDARTSAANDALAAREKAISDREMMVTQREKDADALKDDYQEKLDNLKKLAG